MLTRAQLDRMTAAERLALFDRMLTELYGSTGLAANRRLREDLEIHEQTPYKWRKAPETMPITVLFALDGMIRSEAHLRAQLADAIRGDLAAVAADLARTAEHLASLARRVHDQTAGLVTRPEAASRQEPEA